MPFPFLALAAVLSGTFATVVASIPDSITKISKEEFARLFLGDVSEAESAAIKDAFARMGLDIDPEDGLDAETITRAINTGPLAGTGVELTNIFNRDAVKRDLQRLALVHAAQNFGIELHSLETEAVKEAIRGYVAEFVREEIAMGGDLLDAAPDLVAIVKMIDAARKGYKNEAGETVDKKPLLMSDAAINNRARQAKYRANNKRRWIPR